MSEILESITKVPTWIWILLVFIFLMVKTGKIYKTLWDYEVEFPFKEGVGSAEVDFESKQHKEEINTFVCVKLRLETIYQNKDVEIFLNNVLVYTLPKEKNAGSKGGFNHPLEIAEPSAGDTVSIRIDNNEIFSGPLVRD